MSFTGSSGPRPFSSGLERIPASGPPGLAGVPTEMHPLLVTRAASCTAEPCDICDVNSPLSGPVSPLANVRVGLDGLRAFNEASRPTPPCLSFLVCQSSIDIPSGPTCPAVLGDQMGPPPVLRRTDNPVASPVRLWRHYAIPFFSSTVTFPHSISLRLILKLIYIPRGHRA